jgi:hypothetical protein
LRLRLLTGLAGLGGLSGGLLYLGWVTSWRELSLPQYLYILQKVFVGELVHVRQELFLSMLAGAVLFVLPPIVFYIRRAFPDGGK